MYRERTVPRNYECTACGRQTYGHFDKCQSCEREGTVEAIRPEPAFNGTIKEGMARKFTVLNQRDFDKYCDFDDERALNHIAAKIERGRKKDGKEPYNSYVVINIDEPYIGQIKNIMEKNGHWG